MTLKIIVTGLIVAVATMLVSCGSTTGPISYEVTDLSTGEPVSLESLPDGPSLLVSWATWCRECDEELARLQAFADSEQADGLNIVAVNLDAAHVDDAIWDKVDRHGLTVALWRDQRNTFRSVFGALGVPTSVLLNTQGEVVGTFPGAVNFEDTAILEALEKVNPT